LYFVIAFINTTGFHHHDYLHDVKEIDPFGSVCAYVRVTVL